MTLQNDTNLKFDIVSAPSVFGMNEIAISFHCFNIFPLVKNSRIALVTSSPIIFQDFLMNSTVNPSEPWVLFLGIAKTANLTSSGRTGANSRSLIWLFHLKVSHFTLAILLLESEWVSPPRSL